MRDEYTTLLAVPALGATAIHGIREGDLIGAPAFEEVAGEVRRRLAADLIVAHHARFDLRFLRAEFRRAGHHVAPRPFLCTMALGAMLGLEPRRHALDAACANAGLGISARHSALGDARATAQLLSAYVAHAESAGLDLRGLAQRRGRQPCRSSWGYAPVPTLT